MAIDNNINNYTAADIEKYHQGLLSNKERHDLEKAAMDDPFLADALEGYAVAGVNVANDIAELKKRLAEKTEETKVISLKAAPRNNFKLLRAAVLLAFVAGAGLLIYQFGFNKKDTEIAQVKTTTKEKDGVTDTSKTTVINPATTTTPVFETKSVNGPVTNESAAVTDKETKPGGNTNSNTGEQTPVVTGKTTFDDIVVNKPVEAPVTALPPKAADKKEDKGVVADKVTEKDEVAREEAYKKAKLKSNEQETVVGGGVVKDQSTQQNNRNITPSRKANEQAYSRDQNQNQATNVFRGRVTDADNNGVPFANVTNVQDNNAGTYTDARGFFNLTYPDSILTVQVRSIGFENNNVQLRNAVPNNQVVLQDDRKTLSEVVLSKQKPNSTVRSRDGNLKLDEPEPADGWNNYDTYLTNNLEVPEDLKNRQTGSNEVQVSFEVDKNGEPTNIKVEKSLCAKCDKEAIRLVKEGPKWKRKAKKGRTTVTISF
jgi:TonB family protein